MQNREIRAQSNRNNPIKDTNFMQLIKLQQNVSSITQRNKKKYKEILEQEPDYKTQLYQPNQKLKAQKAFKKQLLLKQLDKLMDQQNIFDKKLAQIKFLKQLELQQQEKYLDKQMNPYQALRTVWAKHQKTSIQAKNSFDKLQSLNFTIGMIKNTINGMKQKEKQYHSQYIGLDEIKVSKHYQKLKQNYERSLMMNEQLHETINSLYKKIQKQQEKQKQLNQKLIQKQKQIKSIKKSKQLQEIDYKLIIAQLKQQLFTVEKKLDKIQKWKSNLQKNVFVNQNLKFKIFIQNTQSQNLINLSISKFKTTEKSLSDIQSFLLQNLHSFNNSNPQLLNFSKLDQQNNEISIPSLNLIQNKDEVCMKKKMPTERPLKAKNFQLQRFIVNKMSNLKYMKIPANLNDQSMKKFVRKNPVMSTSRRLEPQYSERYFQPINQTS